MKSGTVRKLMRKNVVFDGRTLLVALIVAGCSNSGSVSGAAPARATVVRCSEVRTLRQLRDRLSVATNARTGDSVEYLVIGDAERSNDL
jgi:hypothetical protein